MSGLTTSAVTDSDVVATPQQVECEASGFCSQAGRCWTSCRWRPRSARSYEGLESFSACAAVPQGWLPMLHCIEGSSETLTVLLSQCCTSPQVQH